MNPHYNEVHGIRKITSVITGFCYIRSPYGEVLPYSYSVIFKHPIKQTQIRGSTSNTLKAVIKTSLWLFVTVYVAGSVIMRVDCNALGFHVTIGISRKRTPVILGKNGETQDRVWRPSLLHRLVWR